MLSLYLIQALLPVYTYAIAITTTTSTTNTNTIKHTLAKTIPPCAFTCTEHFLEAQYPEHECPDRSDVDCFCRSRTSSGYTLGEGVLRCMLGGCEGDVLRDRASSAYNICEGIEGALRPTHATITVSSASSTVSVSAVSGVGAVSTGTSPAETETGAGAGIGITTGINTDTGTSTSTSNHASPTTSETGAASPNSQTDTNTATTAFTSPTSTTNAGSGSGSGSDTTSTPSSDSKPTSTSDPNAGSGSDSGSSKLSPGSVAGVSVASGLSGFFLIALALFLWRRKQRQSKPSDNHYFEIGGVMSEPPDFAFPPRRPTPTPPKPIPPPKPDTYRLPPDTGASLADTGAMPPAVVVTGVDGHQTDRIGHAISSNLDEDDYRDHAAGLYPEPLRWDRRPRSDITTFEEDDRPQPQQQPQPQPQSQQPPTHSLYPNFSGLIGPRPYPGRMATGLPAHPRAMMYGFTPRNPPVPARYEAGNRWQPESDSQSQSDSTSSSGLGSGSGSGSGSDEPGTRYYNQLTRHNHEVNPEPQPQLEPELRISRHSGYFTTLPPVREARTPSRSENNSPIDYTTSPSLRRPRLLAPGTGPSTPVTGTGPSTPITGTASRTGPPATPATPSHPREIISRPRIIHQQDVKRVQIRRCKPPRQRHLEQRQQQRQSFHSRDLNAVPPYSPDDFWYDPGGYYRSSVSHSSSASATASASGSGSGTGTGIGSGPPTGITVASAPTPPMNRLSGSSAVDKSITRKPVRQHQLTPARRGGDLILRVD